MTVRRFAPQWLTIGIGVGAALGISNGDVASWFVIGTAVGTVLGFALGGRR